MATYSEFQLIFDEEVPIGGAIYVRSTINSSPDTTLLQETWVNQRSQNFQVTLGTPTSIVGERSAINYKQAFDIDHNGTQLYEVIRIGNTVTVKSKYVDQSFTQGFSSDPFLPDGVTLNINNFSGSIFTIDNIEFLPATINPVCTHYKVSVTTSVLANNIVSPVQVNVNTQNPFSFEILRGQSYFLTCNTTDGQSATASFINNIPRYLTPDAFDIQIIPSPNGSTVNISLILSIGSLPLEYSLDNVTWQTQSTFTGLLEGNYTLYIRDNLGCSFSENLIIGETGNVRIPYFKMPKSNSIRFSNRVTWADCSNYKTDENTLSCEADVPVPYKQIQLFQSCDIETQQFRSNYQVNSATIIKQDGNEVNIPVIQATNNMGLKDRRDARKYNLGDGKTGIYFINGNIYDYDTGVDTGEDYTLNGLVPEYAEVGTYIRVDAAWFIIEEIINDESVNADVIVISNNYTGADVLVQVSAVYDLENYEEYEFTIDFVDYIDEMLQVRVDSTDDTFDDIEQLSEVINVKVRHQNTDEFRYKNSTNTDINYSRGLEHKIRMMVERVEGIIIDDTENYKTDSTVRLLESQITEGDKIVFSPMTKQMMQLVCLAVSHDTVKRNGVSYVKNASIEVEGPLEDSNLYDVSVTMLKANSSFNSNVTQGSNTVNGSDTELPGLIESDSGYVSYL